MRLAIDRVDDGRLVEGAPSEGIIASLGSPLTVRDVAFNGYRTCCASRLVGTWRAVARRLLIDVDIVLRGVSRSRLLL